MAGTESLTRSSVRERCHAAFGLDDALDGVLPTAGLTCAGEPRPDVAG
ncbi:hypothetical protein [Amycolatopsis jiangsuensis]|uniref:Uncharacterized protein n=1 Tax=Amycolatopsis jiangsuensis TaxID=1181879 RepID=A0A840IYL3_9PSEU|nr:hypothetical protein [Amycolatopsis jiangsuensis]MBB4685954.1 hypothetical protein [Amycolatopsis jiangsuensis]